MKAAVCESILKICQTSLRGEDAISPHDGVNYSKALRKMKLSVKKSRMKSHMKLGSVKRDLHKSDLYDQLRNVTDSEVDVVRLAQELQKRIKKIKNVNAAYDMGLLS